MALDFPYLSQESEPSAQLMDEVRALKMVITTANTIGYSKIHFVAKSLGAVVASKFLNEVEDQHRYSITVFGYAMPYIHFDNFTG